jgi:hypothetical protein
MIFLSSLQLLNAEIAEFSNWMQRAALPTLDGIAESKL